MEMHPQKRHLQGWRSVCGPGMGVDLGVKVSYSRNYTDRYRKATLRPGTIYISIEPLTIPRPAEYKKGVITLTRMGERENPKAKYTSSISFAEKTLDQIPENVNEVLLVNSKGQILEGLNSNYFAVRQEEI
jgi:branched-subunit amino acid aminotransferase/4-amino-4-deoxychorismate lyase